MRKWWQKHRGRLPDAMDLLGLAGLGSVIYGGEHLASGLGFLLGGGVLVFITLFWR